MGMRDLTHGDNTLDDSHNVLGIFQQARPHGSADYWTSAVGLTNYVQFASVSRIGASL